jgi:hypothetical protein
MGAVVAAFLYFGYFILSGGAKKPLEKGEDTHFTQPTN